MPYRFLKLALFRETIGSSCHFSPLFTSKRRQNLLNFLKNLLAHKTKLATRDLIKLTRPRLLGKREMPKQTHVLDFSKEQTRWVTSCELLGNANTVLTALFPFSQTSGIISLLHAHRAAKQ